MLEKGLEDVRVGFKWIIDMYVILDTFLGSLELLQGVLTYPCVHPAVYTERWVSSLTIGTTCYQYADACRWGGGGAFFIFGSLVSNWGVDTWWVLRTAGGRKADWLWLWSVQFHEKKKGINLKNQNHYFNFLICYLEWKFCNIIWSS